MYTCIECKLPQIYCALHAVATIKKLYPDPQKPQIGQFPNYQKIPNFKWPNPTFKKMAKSDFRIFSKQFWMTESEISNFLQNGRIRKFCMPSSEFRTAESTIFLPPAPWAHCRTQLTFTNPSRRTTMTVPFLCLHPFNRDCLPCSLPSAHDIFSERLIIVKDSRQRPYHNN